MQCRQPSLEGTGEIKLRRLVKEALRMRPSRIVVGEVRQEECLDLLIALNSRSVALASDLRTDWSARSPTLRQSLATSRNGEQPSWGGSCSDSGPVLSSWHCGSGVHWEYEPVAAEAFSVRTAPDVARPASHPGP